MNTDNLQETIITNADPQVRGYAYPPMPPRIEVRKANPELMKKLGPSAILYALFLTLCLYKNPNGITYPFYVAGTIGFSVYIIKKLGASWKKENILVVTACFLLGISTCLTDDTRIVFMNKLLLLFLNVYFILHTYCNTLGWRFGKYVTAMCDFGVKSFGKIFTPFSDLGEYIRLHRNEKNSQVLYALIGVGISVPLILIVGGLLVSADLVFKDAVDTMFNGWDLADIFGVVLWIIFYFAFSYGMITVLQEKDINEKVKDCKQFPPIIAIMSTFVITIIYVLFSYIQITYLFGEKGILPEGFTYAEYAREGFFQLLFVCILNLMIVLVGINLFKESKILKTILCVISLCTFVMIASSAYRMILYIRFYYLTFLRIFVLWALVVIALLMIGIIVQIFKKNFPLFQYGLTIITICYIIFSFSRPDYLIAKVNVGNMVFNVRGYVTEEPLWYSEENENNLPPMQEQFFLGHSYTDKWYINGLCADAAPVIMTEDSVKAYQEYDTFKKEIHAKYEEEVWTDEKQAAYKEITKKETWNKTYMERMLKEAEECKGRKYNFSKAFVKQFL